MTGLLSDDPATRFRATVEALSRATDAPAMGGRIAEARAWYPRAFAAVDAVLAAANDMFPDAGLAMIATARMGWHDSLLLRIGNVEFMADDIELAWRLRADVPSTLPRDGDADAEAEFGRWIADEVAALVHERGCTLIA